MLIEQCRNEEVINSCTDMRTPFLRMHVLFLLAMNCLNHLYPLSHGCFGFLGCRIYGMHFGEST